MKNMEKYEDFYNRNYKKLLIIPFIILLLSIFIIYNHYSKTGDFFDKAVSLKGGLTTTIYTNQPTEVSELEKYLNSKFTESDTSVRKLTDLSTGEQIGLTIEATNMQATTLKTALEEELNIKLTTENYSVEEMGSSLGSTFYKEMLKAILFAFLLMTLVVFVTFRTFVPSTAVIFAAATDMITTIAIIDLLHIKVSTAGISALLLLIAYSVDTDILLTTRMIKRKEGTIFQGMLSSIKTGLTMTITAITALGIGYILSTSVIIKQMFLIIIIGLIMDIFSTYLTNAGILTWYAKKKELEQ